MTQKFSEEVFGKWILAGEHAVLRGHSALVFPVFEKSFRLTYSATGEELRVDFSGPYGEEMRLLFHGVLERALQKVGRPLSRLTGRFEVISTLPVGAGMGASAALCVGITKWLHGQGWVEKDALRDFATDLENIFHGESSGVDIAVALSAQGLLYSKGGGTRPVTPAWQPHWFLSYSGQKGLTSVCVEKVRRALERSPELGRGADERMAEATQLALEALSEPGAFLKLKKSIELGAQSFQDWGLIESELSAHMEELKALGAAAVKPTGSGMGGYVLSLWPEAPRLEGIELIPLNTRQKKVLSDGGIKEGRNCSS